jgi:hypothetical protein
MKKVMISMLMLGLAMPVNAWTLFPKLRDSTESTDEQMVELYKREIKCIEFRKTMKICGNIAERIYCDVLLPWINAILMKYVGV